MNILFLDDDPNRIKAIREFFIGHLPIYCKTAAEAIDLLSRYQYDLIFLDHDLGDQHYDNFDLEDGLSGYEVAKWLEQNPDKQPNVQYIICHSQNPVGSQRMSFALQKSYKSERIPFPILLRQSWLKEL